jgi:D-alanyl-lipoteichoic acid acyltransferase DltB (MBOAT superfamily)
MTFTTFTFLVFTAVTFAAYWTLRTRRVQNALLLVASYVFYGWWDPRFCALMAASSLTDYALALAVAATDDPRRRRALLGVSIVANVGVLALFKYYDFFAQSLVSAAAALGVSLHAEPLRLVLPVGISFYTFQTLGYTIDVYRRRLGPTRDLVQYLGYVSFFPQLVAGPIERGPQLLPQFASDRVFDRELAVDGLRQALWGFVQKVALADNLATIVEGCYEGTCRGPQSMIATVAFAFQIYWDFAGYSNIAIGTAKLFGIRLSQNFAYPYFSRSVAEFWRRWHITLSTWFRDYVYVPLGGNRRGRARQAVAVVVTFTLSGLWHGASWTFVVWGLFNGMLALPSILRARAMDGPSTVPGGDGGLPSPTDLGRMLVTFTLVCIGWVFFRAASLPAALALLAAMVRDVADPMAWRDLAAHADHLRGFLSALGIVVVIEWVQRRHPHALVLPRWPRPLRWLLYTALVWSMLYVMREDPTRFIYFQF